MRFDVPSSLTGAPAITRRDFNSLVAGASLLSSKFARADAASLGPLNGHSGAFDQKAGASYVFGGADEKQVLNRLWQFRSGCWQLLSETGPPGRTFPAVVFDDRRSRLIVFGGNSVLFGQGGNTILDDHWEWDGREWSQFTGPRPPGRSEACFAYDQSSGNMILFGGWRYEAGERIRLGDLWRYDGSQWKQDSRSGPPPRSGATMAFNGEERAILMIGGNGPRADCWLLAEAGWRETSNLPQPVFNPALAYDRAHRRTVKFGGWNGSNRVARTQLFRNPEWLSHTGPEPPPRNHSLLLPQGDGRRLLLIGGHTGDHVLADEWEWNNRWFPIRLRDSVARVDNGH